MGCQCFKSEENRKSSVLESSGYNISKERINTGNIEVRNCGILDVDTECYVGVSDEQGRSAVDLFQKESLQQKMKAVVREDLLTFGTCYPQDYDNRKRIMVLPLPLWSGQEQNILQKALNNLVQQVRQLQITSICIDELGVRFFGYPRQLVIEAIVKAFQVLLSEASSLEKIYFVSKDLFTVNMFEVQIRGAIPQNSVVEERKSRQPSISTNELSKPLLS